MTHLCFDPGNHRPKLSKQTLRLGLYTFMMWVAHALYKLHITLIIKTGALYIHVKVLRLSGLLIASLTNPGSVNGVPAVSRPAHVVSTACCRWLSAAGSEGFQKHAHHMRTALKETIGALFAGVVRHGCSDGMSVVADSSVSSLKSSYTAKQ